MGPEYMGLIILMASNNMGPILYVAYDNMGPWNIGACNTGLNYIEPNIMKAYILLARKY